VAAATGRWLLWSPERWCVGGVTCWASS
jgi:hypothetical protein